MTVEGLQSLLAAAGRYRGAIDGQFGPKTEGAVLTAMTDGPDTKLIPADYRAAAETLGCEPAAVRAFAEVESAGEGFMLGRPVLLFEPHRFSAATKHRWDATHPNVSYPDWDPKRYPKPQGTRYGQLLEAAKLDIDAAFASASYGKFQILGENYRLCGYVSAFAFAVGMAKDEQAQLAAFVRFIINRGLADDLQAKRWDTLARGYNGTAYRQNGYDMKLADAYERVAHA
jgi:hypothetical protein